jgi:anti-sigma regulatory factor (Ser/Thr protein kinase)
VELTAAVPVAEAIRTLGSVLLPSVDEARQRYPVMFGREGPVSRGERAWAWLPLRVGTRVVGGMGLSFATERSFDGQERWALETLADQVAQALERSRSHAAEHRIAAVLQESLLPSAFRNVGPARVAARYLPAATEASVGGDWFEMLDLPGERLAVAVGDVVGSGIGAAAAMGQIRSAVRVLALAGKHPMELLETMDSFAESVEGASMSTAVCAELDMRTGRIIYACAGHPPSLVVGPGGARFLEGGRRPPLSMPPANAVASDASAHLQPGETLVLYTDGLIERRGEAVDEGLQRLAAVATELADRGPDALAERIVSQLLPDGAADDAAVLCVRYEPVTAASTAPDFVMHLPAAAEELAGLRSAIRGWSMRASIPADVTEEIVLAIGEACGNAIEHAYRDRPGDPTVELKLRAGGEVQADIRDDGRWRDEGPASTRGRGMTLMRALMDTVDVEPGASGTTVVMRRRVEPSQGRSRDGENTPPRER